MFVSQEKKQILSKLDVTMLGKETSRIIKELNFRTPGFIQMQDGIFWMKMSSGLISKIINYSTQKKHIIAGYVKHLKE